MTRTQFELPACFDSWAEWDSWKSAARVRSQPEQASICSDCLPGYMDKMVDARRCDRRGWSTVIFGPRIPAKKLPAEATS